MSLTHWTSSGYPDLRGPTVSKCAVKISPGEQYYICDPDHVLNASEARSLNQQLHNLTIGTPCHCQRRSQCTTTGDDVKNPSFHGFVASIALVNNLQMTIHSPSEQQLLDRAENFCRTLEGRWALGDCGNSVLIFIWKHYKKVIIWPARLAQRYVTARERRRILDDVNNFIQNDKWYEALKRVIAALHDELKGEPEVRIDTGTLSLIIAVGVAVLLTIMITCCVCAFRCCGNMRSDQSDRLGKSLQRIDSLRNQIIRHGTQLRRSFSRSPKFGSFRECSMNSSFISDAGNATFV
ncbi:hypothetical protein LOAG_05236 [Loa loa]|uniref:Uncharacterized protein n=1 Tax=Loa loa TaxID=7209 RepID=A0A1S0U228_LOALO|nr:hypothetical protein LOAG_05236 [Loa loa]EFO23247.1 hypothetical protein LOAG_05236 [Loa loa]